MALVQGECKEGLWAAQESRKGSLKGQTEGSKCTNYTYVKVALKRTLKSSAYLHLSVSQNVV